MLVDKKSLSRGFVKEWKVYCVLVEDFHSCRVFITCMADEVLVDIH